MALDPLRGTDYEPPKERRSRRRAYIALAVMVIVTASVFAYKAYMEWKIGPSVALEVSVIKFDGDLLEIKKGEKSPVILKVANPDNPAANKLREYADRKAKVWINYYEENSPLLGERIIIIEVFPQSQGE